VQRTPLPVHPCFPLLSAPRLPDLSLPDPRPPDCKTPNPWLLRPPLLSCRVHQRPDLPVRHSQADPVTLAAATKTFVAVLPCLHAAGRRSQGSLSLSAFPPPCTDSVSAINSRFRMGLLG
jgi:hypothetical protein